MSETPIHDAFQARHADQPDHEFGAIVVRTDASTARVFGGATSSTPLPMQVREVKWCVIGIPWCEAMRMEAYYKYVGSQLHSHEGFLLSFIPHLALAKGPFATFECQPLWTWEFNGRSMRRHS
jgi:hypothetical protein